MDRTPSTAPRGEPARAPGAGRAVRALAIAALLALAPGARLLLPGNAGALAAVAFPRLFGVIGGGARSAGSAPGPDLGTDRSTNPSTNPSTDPSTDSRSNPSTDSRSNPGTNPTTDSRSNPGTDAGATGTDPSAPPVALPDEAPRATPGAFSLAGPGHVQPAEALATLEALRERGAISSDVADAMRRSIGRGRLPRDVLVAYLNDLLGIAPAFADPGALGPTRAQLRATEVWVPVKRRASYDETNVRDLVRTYLALSPQAAAHVRRLAERRAATP